MRNINSSKIAVLDQIKVASPCIANWADLPGTERARFCDQCNLRVHNLSAMSRTEAANLIAKNVGRLCVRFEHFSDGKPITTSRTKIIFHGLSQQVKSIASAASAAVLSFLLLATNANALSALQKHSSIHKNKRSEHRPRRKKAKKRIVANSTIGAINVIDTPVLLDKPPIWAESPTLPDAPPPPPSFKK